MIAYTNNTTAPTSRNNSLWFDPNTVAATTVFILPGGWIEAEPNSRESRADHARTCRSFWSRPSNDTMPADRETGVLRSGRRSKGSMNAARQLPIPWFN